MAQLADSERAIWGLVARVHDLEADLAKYRAWWEEAARAALIAHQRIEQRDERIRRLQRVVADRRARRGSGGNNPGGGAA